MFTLFAAPGACSRVPLMTLEEAGADYSVELVRFMKGAHKAPDYLALNPSGKVPLLITPEGPLTENVAIARYLASLFSGLLPKTTSEYQDAKVTADLAFFSATIHPLVTRNCMPMLLVDGDDAQAALRSKAADALTPYAAVIDNRLTHGPWWYGDDWSVLDAYAYWVWSRLASCGFDRGPFPRWAAHAARMEARPAIQRALECDAGLVATLKSEGLIPPQK